MLLKRKQTGAIAVRGRSASRKTKISVKVY